MKWAREGGEEVLGYRDDSASKNNYCNQVARRFLLKYSVVEGEPEELSGFDPHFP